MNHKICPECDAKALDKTDDRHWYCSECEKSYLVKEWV